AEAARVYELYQAGIVRELYFRADRHEAVLMLECADLTGAQAALQTLPLVAAGLITFELIPLTPYTGWERLFASLSMFSDDFIETRDQPPAQTREGLFKLLPQDPP
ncbi:MAG: hypothetical protein WCF84_01985, partial [Anaerolineae bacterium]